MWFPFSLCFTLQWTGSILIKMYFHLSPLSMVHIFHCPTPPLPSLVSLLRFALSLSHIEDCEESVLAEEPRKSKDCSVCGRVCVFVCGAPYCRCSCLWTSYQSLHAGVHSIPLHFLIRYRIPERRLSPCGTAEIPFLVD